MDTFTDACLRYTATPYVIRNKDAVQLATLRRAFAIENLQKPPDWDAAVENYFATPSGTYSLAWLAAPEHYCVLRNSPLDRFGKPINHIHSRRNHEHPSSASVPGREEEIAIDAYLALFGGIRGRV
jgi:hypothetical protein